MRQNGGLTGRACALRSSARRPPRPRGDHAYLWAAGAADRRTDAARREEARETPRADSCGQASAGASTERRAHGQTAQLPPSSVDGRLRAGEAVA
eukprot:5936067-Prymnesium_polylepis.2